MTKGTPWQLSRAAISAIERGQNFPGMEAMLALSNVLFVDPKELIERARLAMTVPVDVTGIPLEELEKKASAHFWDGEFREALAIYDAMLEIMTLEERPVAEAARLEVKRATALRRTNALLAALSTAERAIGYAVDQPAVQAEAYIVLASVQCDRGNLPLACDAADRAIELAADADARTRGMAWIVKANSLFYLKKFEEARQGYLEARKLAVDEGDRAHQTHIEGNIGMCWLKQGQLSEARTWVRRAIELAREQVQPTLEASWLVELGCIAMAERRPDEADTFAQAAIRIAKPLEHHLTVFRAEWLRHKILKQQDPQAIDRHRLAYLRKLMLLLDQHEGIEDVQEFKRTVLRTTETSGESES